MKEKKMITSRDAEKYFASLQHPFITQQSCIEVTYLNTIKVMYEKPTANAIINGGKQKALILRSGRGQECPLLPILFNVVLKFPARVIRKDKEKASK